MPLGKRHTKYKTSLPQGQPGSAVTPHYFERVQNAAQNIPTKSGILIDKLRKEAKTARGGDVPPSVRAGRIGYQDGRRVGEMRAKTAREDIAARQFSRKAPPSLQKARRF